MVRLISFTLPFLNMHMALAMFQLYTVFLGLLDLLATLVLGFMLPCSCFLETGGDPVILGYKTLWMVLHAEMLYSVLSFPFSLQCFLLWFFLLFYQHMR